MFDCYLSLDLRRDRSDKEYLIEREKENKLKS